VTAVSYDDSFPLGFPRRENWETLEVEGYVPGRNENMKIYRDLISPGYFESMKIPCWTAVILICGTTPRRPR